MKKFIFYTFIELIMLLVSPLPSYAEEKSYVLTNDQVENMPGQFENLFDFTDLKIVMRERYINGSVSIFSDLDDDNFEFEVKMYTSPNSDGVYQLMAMGVPRTPVCEGFKKFFVKFVQPSLIHGENTNFPYIDVQEGLCPIPKGDYWLKGILVDTEDWPSQFPRGLLKIVASFYKNDLVVGGITIIFKVEDADT